ncbi:Pimeloyl-ACP methyl ester carboxylesterase [Dyadobacter koreensis]|uniref:Pimeloyl-ACP methyl ester carboxylesterase n=1 Tax=Dyadobacter koreensis TaxID=408657 RepID=A0A1H6UQ82_9BACT|nr:alpha/beta hydrolase [Dyadobacter koreensis]SEI94469.1 Pimeloyl-ACP methyl ester carboxylesterase [Dyadobacter koreensis]
MKLAIFFLLASFPALAQFMTGTAKSDSEKNFRAAKAKFLSFEKTHGHFFETRNIKMHYLTWGNPKDTPLIWLHGSLSTGYEMLPLADRLVQEGYFIIAPDYYGHGQTPVPKLDLSLYHVADDVNDLMRHLKIKKAVIGGWSRGGFIASAFYDAYPEKVSGLILEDGGSVATNTYYHKMDSTELIERVKSFSSQVFADTSYATELEAYEAFYDTNQNDDQFELLTWIRQNEKGAWVVAPGLWKLFNMSTYEESMDNIFRPTRSPLFAESMAVMEPKIIYRNLHVPMLILDPTDKEDLFPFESENAALKNKHPCLITHIIFSDTTHNIHAQRPEQFTSAVLLFLQSLKRIQK